MRTKLVVVGGGGYLGGSRFFLRDMVYLGYFPRVVERLGLGNYFAGYVVSSAVGYEKPRAEIFQRALRAAGDPEICYMIGDNPIADIRGGHEVGMKTVLVHTAGGSGADWNCARLAEIPAILV